VEQSPILPIERAEVLEHNQHLRNCLAAGATGKVRKIDSRERAEIQAFLADENAVATRALHQVRDSIRVKAAKENEDPVTAFVGGPLPPIHQYRIPFDLDVHSEIDLESLPDAIRSDVHAAVETERVRLTAALDTGWIDERKPLDDVRREFFERMLEKSDPETHPEVVPPIFLQAACNVFGHICPVFFAGEALTETAETRRRGRYIPFKIKMRVVRRDNYTCQHCGRHLRDDEVEFDHKIPVARGGNSEEHNIRLTCYDCNRDKSDSVEI
jgi:hypothetical protein